VFWRVLPAWSNSVFDEAYSLELNFGIPFLFFFIDSKSFSSPGSNSNIFVFRLPRSVFSSIFFFPLRLIYEF
jgi:hypothetical protein